MALYCIRYSYEISIHAPHTGRDAPLWPHMVTRWKFQSTRPIRGATSLPSGRKLYYVISIHAPHTGRDAPAGAVVCIEVISIHAPHTGRDTPRTFSAFIPALFQSTRPIRGATHRRGRQALQDHISIHAPHTGRDLADKTVCATLNRISIHAPHPGRDWG